MSNEVLDNVRDDVLANVLESMKRREEQWKLSGLTDSCTDSDSDSDISDISDIDYDDPTIPEEKKRAHKEYFHIKAELEELKRYGREKFGRENASK